MQEDNLLNLRHIGTYLPELRQQIAERGGRPLLPLTTLPDLSKKIWGLKPGLTILAARTSQGKTTMALQMAHDLAAQGHPVLFISLEMSVEDILERLFCNLHQVDNFELISGAFKKDPQLQKEWIAFEAHIRSLKLIITDRLGFTFNDINKALAGLSEKPHAIFIDYIQAIKTTGGNKEREEINEYIRQFRQICVENKIAGVLCSQISRAVFQPGKGETSREPSLEHLKGSGALEEHSDMVILLHWPWFYTHKDDEKSTYKVLVAKNRGGQTGRQVINYFPEHYRFEEVAKSPKDQPASAIDVESLFGKDEKDISVNQSLPMADFEETTVTETERAEEHLAEVTEEATEEATEPTIPGESAGETVEAAETEESNVGRDDEVGLTEATEATEATESAEAAEAGEQSEQPEQPEQPAE